MVHLFTEIMRRQSYIKNKILSATTISLMAILLAMPLNVHAEPAIFSQHSSVSIRSDVTRWVYKNIDGKLYKRLYNYTTDKWMSDWILV